MVRGTVFTLAMPPTGLVLLMLVGLLLRGSWHRFGRRLTWASLIVFILLGMPAVSYSMLRSLETDLPMVPPADHPPQAIVVLGGDVIRSHQEKLGIRAGLLSLDRLRTAAELARRTGLPILITGGTNVTTRAPVALAMAESLKTDFRITPRWVEAKSRDTLENARFSADILHAEGIDSVYVVTHAWHMRRALLSFEGTGLTVTAAPTPLDDSQDTDSGDFVPRVAGWQTAYYALHEWFGYAWYRFR